MINLLCQKALKFGRNWRIFLFLLIFDKEFFILVIRNLHIYITPYIVMQLILPIMFPGTQNQNRLR